MNSGLATTFRVLSKTKNEAALGVLLPALNNPVPTIHEKALVAILNRRTSQGHRELLARLPNMTQRWLQIIRQNPGRLTGAFREAVLDPDPAIAQKGCQAAALFEDFDLIPTLLTVLEDADKTKIEMAAETLVQLISELYKHLQEGSAEAGKRDYKWIAQHIIASMETSLQRFGKHRRREVVDAFLLLADRNNKTLNQILQNPHHVGFIVVVDTLAKSQQSSMMDLLLSYLEDEKAPTSVLSTITGRCDSKFIRNFIKTVGLHPSPAVLHNLKRIESITWLKSLDANLSYMDDVTQQALVQLARATNISKDALFAVIELMIKKGKPCGRRAAVETLEKFQGLNANALALKALDDADPQVQALVIPQLRQRGIPGIFPRLVEMVDHPSAMIRRVVRQNLTEFSFKRFLNAFDILDDDVRRTTGELVLKIDPETIPLLSEELKSPVRSRRLRGLQMAHSLKIVDKIEDRIIELMHDEDHFVRAEAAETLATSRSENAREVLQAALHDRSPMVQEAARRSLAIEGEPPTEEIPAKAAAEIASKAVSIPTIQLRVGP